MSEMEMILKWSFSSEVKTRVKYAFVVLTWCSMVSGCGDHYNVPDQCSGFVLCDNLRRLISSMWPLRTRRRLRVSLSALNYELQKEWVEFWVAALLKLLCMPSFCERPLFSLQYKMNSFVMKTSIFMLMNLKFCVCIVMYSKDGFNNWMFATVRCWGEKPTGVWMLIVSDKGNNKRIRVCVDSWILQYLVRQALFHSQGTAGLTIGLWEVTEDWVEQEYAWAYILMTVQ